LSDRPDLSNNKDGDSNQCPGGPANRVTAQRLGTNIDGIAYWSEPYLVNFTKYFGEWKDVTADQLNEFNYPKQNVSTRAEFMMKGLPGGLYKVSYKGTGTVAFTGMGALEGSWNIVGDERRGNMRYTPSSDPEGRVWLHIYNGPFQTVSDIRIYLQEEDYGSKNRLRNLFLEKIAPFRFLRFMDTMNTNGTNVVNWADRNTPQHFSYMNSKGIAYEEIVEIANVTGKDIWVNIPHKASADWSRNFAKFLRDNLDFDRIAAIRKCQHIDEPFSVFVEYSNEVWNSGFAVNAWVTDEIAKNPTLYSQTYDNEFGPDWLTLYNKQWLALGKYVAGRITFHSDIMREEFATAGRSGVIQPVLAGWAVAPAVIDVGLKFIKNSLGRSPDTVISQIAIAPYFAPESDSHTTTLDAIFSNVKDVLQNNTTAYIRDTFAVSTKYKIPLAAYEGGQHITGDTNRNVKQLAQYDIRMSDAYKSYLKIWRQESGNGLFGHYSMAGGIFTADWGLQYGYWGAIESIRLDPAVCSKNLPVLASSASYVPLRGKHCPKWEALMTSIRENGF